MRKGRSSYKLELSCDPNVANNLVQSYLQTNKFSLVTKNGEQFYRAGDAMIEGYRYFNYSLTGQTLTIYAWLNSVLGDVPLEQNSLNMFAMNYRNSLNTLFQELSKANSVGSMNNFQNTELFTNQTIQNNPNDFAQTFQDETTKKQEKMCEIGFWLSILGLLASFVGVAYGVIIYILNFYFASQGLKTKKRGKAIATIVLSIISILVIIITLMNA